MLGTPGPVFCPAKIATPKKSKETVENSLIFVRIIPIDTLPPGPPGDPHKLKFSLRRSEPKVCNCLSKGLQTIIP